VTEYEPFLWYSIDNDDWVYNGDDIRVPYRSERVKNPVYKTNKNGEKVAWNPDPRGAKRGDVWEYPALTGKVYEDERTDHPTQKPESLIIDLIKGFCPKNPEGKYEGRVLDIYAGSGTTLVACERLNAMGHHIEWVGCELEQRWVDEGNRRIAEIKNSLSNTLFGNENG
jgi:site-specific DNA-methyltransferase (adenine-specific)